MLGKNLTIVKAENGNVLIKNNADDILVSIPTGTPIELNNTLLQFRLGPTVGGGIIGFGASQVSETQTEGSAAVPFTGTIQDLFTIMEGFVASPAGSGGSGSGGATSTNQLTQIAVANDIKANTTGLATETTLQQLKNSSTLEGKSKVRIIAQATNNARVLKVGSGTFCGFEIASQTTAKRYLKIYNKATAPNPLTDAALLVATYEITAANGRKEIVTPANCPNGVSMAVVTGIADNNNAPTVLNDFILTLFYQ
jgi:hypothetical protein